MGVFRSGVIRRRLWILLPLGCLPVTQPVKGFVSYSLIWGLLGVLLSGWWLTTSRVHPALSQLFFLNWPAIANGFPFYIYHAASRKQVYEEWLITCTKTGNTKRIREMQNWCTDSRILSCREWLTNAQICRRRAIQASKSSVSGAAVPRPARGERPEQQSWGSSLKTNWIREDLVLRLHVTRGLQVGAKLILKRLLQGKTRQPALLQVSLQPEWGVLAGAS